MRFLNDNWEILPNDLQIQMIRNHVYVEDPNRLFSYYIGDMTDWCNENCSGLYRLCDINFYFENEEDAMSFKLYWHGKK